ncbi:MAG: hypothetical protein NUV46_00725 [Nanoarchaeota archaeon]|nr:hypothetical protein [Nanoarchaeota archaeon]
MPDVAPREVLGLQMLQREAAVGPPPDMATVLRSAAEKSLQEGRSKKALENLADTGKSLDLIKMGGQYNDLFKEDKIATSGDKLEKSSQQKSRIKTGENTIKDIKEFVEHKRYDSITDPAIKDNLKNNLTDYLINNPAFLAAKQLIDPTFDITSTAARGQVELDALAILKDPLLFDGLKTVTTDYLATTNIDYKELHKLLKQKMELSKEIDTLTTEVGTGGTGGSGLTKVVEDMEKDLKEYEIYTDPSNPANVIKGSYATLKEGYHNDELTNTSEIKKYESSISKANSVLQQIMSASISTFPVLDPISNALVNIDAMSASTYLTNWGNKIDDLNRVVTDLKLKQQLIDQDKTKKKAEFDEKKAEKIKKEGEKKTKEKSLKDLEDGSLTDEQKKVKEEEENVSKRAQGLLAEAVTNLWQDMSTEADKARTEKLKGLEGDCQKMAIETLLKKVNPTKKAYDVKQLKKYRDELTRDGIDKFGTTRIDELIADYSGTGATPEQKNLVPILDGIRKDPTKLKEFSTSLVKDMLGTIAYKNPKLLERLFTEDEIHMKGLLGDVLPDLIMKAHEDTASRSKAEEYFGKKMTKSSVGEKLKGLLKSKGFWAIFGILAALGLLGFFALKP